MTSSQDAAPPTPAELYENVLVNDLFGPLARTVMEIASPKPGDRIIDIACGTGIILREAAARVSDLAPAAGVDSNPAMIDVARTISRDLPMKIDWYDVDVASMPFDAEQFDLAYCQQGLQFFPDPQQAVSEVRRILRPEGAFVNITWKELDLHPFVNGLNDVGRSETGLEALEQPFSLGSRDKLIDLFESAGFRDIQSHDATVTINWHDPETNVRMLLMGATAAIPQLQTMDQEERVALVERIITNSSPVFEAHSMDGVITTDWHANVVIGTR